MARFITFNGVTIYHPGGLTKVDVSGLSQVGAGASGIVALVGEADGGQPNTALTPKVYEFSNPQNAVEEFVSGPLADAMDFVFNPSNDPRIPGGAQTVLVAKTNQSTQASGSLPDQPAANTSVDFLSRKFGAPAQLISVTTSVNAADDNTLDCTVTDGVTSLVETFTAIGGTPLMDVQYRGPSAPTARETAAGASEHTIAAAPATNQIQITLDISSGCAPGNWVQILTVPAVPATAAACVGQMRRINTVVGGPPSVLTLDDEFLQGTGVAVTAADLVGCTFQVIREVMGPFFVSSATANTATLNGASSVAHQPAGWSVGDPTFSVLHTLIGTYGAIANGLCYVKITAGTGAGQIRRCTVTTGTDAIGAKVAGPQPNVITTADNWTTNPDATSQLMFINTSARLNPHVAADSNTDCGARAIVEGANGAASLLLLSVLSGGGEDDGVGGVIPVAGAGIGAGAGYLTQYQFTLGSTITVQQLVNQINNGIDAVASAASVIAGLIDPLKDAWNARVGLGRDHLLTSDRFDFMVNGGTPATTDVTNGLNPAAATSGAIDCLVDFNQTFNNTWLTSAGVNHKKHRVLDNLSLLIDTLNSGSLLVSASRTTTGASDGDGVPQFGASVTLAGATVGSTSFADIQRALDELLKQRHDTTVALFSGPGTWGTAAGVHAALLQHVQNGRGAWKNEVDAIAAFDPPTAATALPDILANANAVSDHDMAMVYQTIRRINVNGVTTDFEPHMLAAAIAGMQAGSPVGTPLTFKFVQALDIISPTLADPSDPDDARSMLIGGILFAEKTTRGFRIVRNLTTWTANDNLARTDRNVNYELNYMAYDLRTFIENLFVGAKATPTTVANIKSAVITKLNVYRDDIEIITDSNDPVTGEAINAYRNLKVTISGDIATIRFEVFPTIGINFMKFEIFAQLPVISA